MSDLFTRLAERARADAALTVMPEVDPDFALLDQEAPDLEANPAVPPASALTAQPEVPTTQSPINGDRAVDGRSSPRPDGTEIRLVPMPVSVAPTAPVTAFAPARLTDSAAAAGSLTMPPVVSLPESPRSVELPVRLMGALTPIPLSAEARPPGEKATGLDRERPTIDITVGRIEVRVRPPAAARTGKERRASEPPPALSLEEYLRQREASS